MPHFLQLVDDPDHEALLRLGDILDSFGVAHRPWGQASLRCRPLGCQSNNLVDRQGVQLRNPLQDDDAGSSLAELVGKYCLLRNAQLPSKLRLGVAS